MPDGQAAHAEALRPLYHRFAWAYDLIVARPAGGAIDGIGDRMDSLGVPPGGLIVDAGCGTGRYARALADRGFRVIGVDRSAALIEEARAHESATSFTCADLLMWTPTERADAVLCRGVLNDLITDRERSSALASFASWLRTDGVLVADVREWDATLQRYSTEPRHERSVRRRGRTLHFVSKTRLDHQRHVMHVRERYTGTVDSVAIDETYDFVMRCWTIDEVRRYLGKAGFATVDVQRDAIAGVAADRLSVIGRR